MKRILIAMCMLFAIIAGNAGEKRETVSSSDLVGSFPKKAIIGPLGVALGRYVTIEGQACYLDWERKEQFPSAEVVAKNGLPGLKVRSVDGVKLNPPVIIRFNKRMKVKPASTYVIRGYQTGRFTTAGADPDSAGITDDHPKIPFQFVIELVVTKDLTDDKHETNKNSEPKGSR